MARVRAGCRFDSGTVRRRLIRAGKLGGCGLCCVRMGAAFGTGRDGFCGEGCKNGLGEERGMRVNRLRGIFGLAVTLSIFAAASCAAVGAMAIGSVSAASLAAAMPLQSALATSSAVAALNGVAQQPAATAPAMMQVVGTVKAIAGNVFTLTLDSGAEVLVTVSEATKIVQVAPGSKDLKSATPIQLTD